MNQIYGWETPYLSALEHLLNHGEKRETRNGVTLADFVHTMRFDLKEGFPILTTKKVNFNLLLAELLWFLEGGLKPNPNRQEIAGHMSLRRLEEIYGDHITQMWVGDAENFKERGKSLFPGDCGRIYGSQWRSWKKYTHLGGAANIIQTEEIDQIVSLIKKLKENPSGRYARVTAWNPGELDLMSLPACHTDFQCFVKNGKLSLHMNQRSADMFLGVPFNIASYALLTHMLAQVTSYDVGEIIITFNDYHIYEAHIPQVKEQLSRRPFKRPKLSIDESIKDIDSFRLNHFHLSDFFHHPAIKAPVLTANVK